MNPRHLAKVLGMLGVVAMTSGCPTGWNPWPKPAEPTPNVKPTLPAYEQVLRLGEMLTKKQFAPGEEVLVDASIKARILPGSLTMTVLWCDGFSASKSIDTTRERNLWHPPFEKPMECWVVAELFSDKEKVGDASMSFSIATSSVAATPTPAPPASPSVAATPTPAPTPVPTRDPISPYRVL